MRQRGKFTCGMCGMTSRTRKGLTCGVRDAPDYICKRPVDPSLWALRELARIGFGDEAANGEHPP